MDSSLVSKENGIEDVLSFLNSSNYHIRFTILNLLDRIKFDEQSKIIVIKAIKGRMKLEETVAVNSIAASVSEKYENPYL